MVSSHRNKHFCPFFFQKDIGLEPEQVEVLMKCFNGFCNEGVVHADTVGEILQMMGLRVKKEALTAIIAEVDEDGRSLLYYS